MWAVGFEGEESIPGKGTLARKSLIKFRCVERGSTALNRSL